MQAIAPGEVIAGKYRIEREIGRGGMGVVFAALHVDLDQPVAVKILHDYAAYDQDAVARLLREARAAARISSNHVVRVMDVGSLAEGGAYIAMELLDGRDLADILRDQGPLVVDDAVDYLIEACDAVAVAHAAGIVHRDLKPANLFVAQMPDGSPAIKVLDFGVSKVAPKSGETATPGVLTQTGQIFGSPNYMSPEQLRSATDVDGRTDIWALGVVFYELVSGKLPFGGTSMADVLAAVVRDTPAPLSQVCPSVPREISLIIARCLEKEPADRFANIVELASALAPFASTEKQALVERIKRVVFVRSAAPSRSGATDPFPTPSRGVSRDKQNTPNMVAVERGSPGGSSQPDSLASVPATAKPYRAMLYGMAGLAIVLIGVAATKAATSKPPIVMQPAPVVASSLSVSSVPLPLPEPSRATPVVRPAESVQIASVMSSKVKLDIATKPVNVQVVRDNVRLGNTPLTLEFDRSGMPIKLMFNAWGYRSQELLIVPDGDRTMLIELVPTGSVRSPTKNSGRLPGDLEPF